MTEDVKMAKTTCDYGMALVACYHVMSFGKRKGVNIWQAAFLLNTIFPSIGKDQVLRDLVEVVASLRNSEANPEMQAYLKGMQN